MNLPPKSYTSHNTPEHISTIMMRLLDFIYYDKILSDYRKARGNFREW